MEPAPEPTRNAVPTPGKLLTMIPGVNIGTWADTKWARGATHSRELEQRIRAWAVTRPLRTTAELVTDRMLEYRLDIITPPPVEEWSAIVGDILHNYRSALDAVTWSMATWNGATPTDVRAVQFPMAQTEKSWNDWAKKTPTIPEEFRQRIRGYQPFVNGPTPPNVVDALQALHQLDILDKHREAISVNVGLNTSDLKNAIFDLDAGQWVESQIVNQDVQFRQGEPLMRIVTDRPLRVIEVGMGIVSSEFLIPYEAGSLDLVGCLNALGHGTRNILDDLYGIVPMQSEEPEPPAPDEEARPAVSPDASDGNG